MNKLISLIIIGAALVWSWNRFNTAQPVNFETHSGIQLRLAELIRTTLKQKLPNVEDVKINRLWTEAVSEDEIKAVFSYEFKTPLEEGDKVAQVVEGEAFLKRSAAHADEWSLERVVTGTTEMSFTGGTLVTPPGETPAQPATTSTPAEKSQESGH